MPLSDTLRHLTGLYAASDDPWDHRSSEYERRKYKATLASIGHGPFAEALEIGCGNGTLLTQLAPRCARLTGIECIPSAAQAARQATAHQAHVTVLEGQVPRDIPSIRPDLILMSEVLYFLTPDDIAGLSLWLKVQNAMIVCVNWMGSTDEDLDGNTAVALLTEAMQVDATTTFHPEFRIDVFRSGNITNGPARG